MKLSAGGLVSSKPPFRGVGVPSSPTGPRGNTEAVSTLFFCCSMVVVQLLSREC